MASTTDIVRIHYRRPPDREEVFVQQVVHREAGCTITFLEAADVAPMRVQGAVVLEPASPIVWFTFDDAWHDIGRFHRADGTFTGCYANVLTPVRMSGDRWDTTDLFLDVWLPPGGAARVLDEDELASAAANGAVDEATARRAQAEAAAIVGAASRGAWPPPIVDAWPLERVRRHLGRHGGTRHGPAV